MDISREYSEIMPGYEDFLKEVKRTIEKLLVRYEIPVAFEISGRTKEQSSILEKQSSNRATISASITELNDLAGIRIVLLFPEYKEKVADLLSGQFDLLERSLPVNNPKLFGYNSIHLVLRIKEDWLKTVNWEEHSGKKIEVQIRTLSEHIWAETSHSLFYKKEENIPNIMQRDLSRLAALLEVVDEKMQNIKVNIIKHFEHIRSCPYEEILTMDLNPETFKRVMLHHSKEIYKNDEKQNKILSSEVESKYNMLTASGLDGILVTANMHVDDLNSSSFIKEVFRLLDDYKKMVDKRQENKE